MESKNHIIELVVYRVKSNPTDNKQIVINKTNAGLVKLDGFIYRKVYQSTEDPNLLFDFVAWDTLENAINAAKNMSKIPELGDFIQLIEKTELFEHFSFSNQHSIADKESKTVELVIYQLKEENNNQIGDFFSTYNSEIKNAKGYNNRVLLQSAKNKNVWAERVFWDSISQAKENELAMQKNPILGAAFSIVEKVIVMKHFIEFE
jgi:heme-degrading monooxygenase HmoA